MLTRIDHVMICVPDLAQGDRNLHAPRVHRLPRRLAHRPADPQRDRLPRRGLPRDPEHPRSERGVPGSPDASLAEYLDAGRRVPDRGAAERRPGRGRRRDARARRGRGRDPRRRAAPRQGQELRWHAAFLGPRDALPIFFIQHLTPLAERKAHAAPCRAHPNGVTRVERVYVAVPDVAASARTYARVLGRAGARDPPGRGDQGGHGGVRPRPDRAHGGPAHRAGPRRGGAGPARARARSRCCTVRAISRRPRARWPSTGSPTWSRGCAIPASAPCWCRRSTRPARTSGSWGRKLPGLPPRLKGRRCWS